MDANKKIFDAVSKERELEAKEEKESFIWTTKFWWSVYVVFMCLMWAVWEFKLDFIGNAIAYVLAGILGIGALGIIIVCAAAIIENAEAVATGIAATIGVLIILGLIIAICVAFPIIGAVLAVIFLLGLLGL